MTKTCRLAAWIGLLLMLELPLAQAACIEDPRRIQLAKDNVVRLKSYLCRERQGSEEIAIKVEFHRFNDTSAALVINKGASTLLKQTIGSPKLIENETYAAYAELLKRFGETGEESGETITRTSVGTPGAPTVRQSEDTIGKEFITIFGSSDTRSYPAAAEIQSLMKKTLPTGMRFYYRMPCNESGIDASGATVCRRYAKDKINTMFWRGLRQQDLRDYGKNLAAYNDLVRETDRRKGKKTDEYELFDEQMTAFATRYGGLLDHLTNGNWPDDFYILEGEYVLQDCGGDAGEPWPPFGWSFSFLLRSITLDAVLIRNQSKQPIRIDKLLGRRSAETSLREAAAATAPDLAQTAAEMAEMLAPGESILVPTQIKFGPPVSVAKDRASVSATIQRRKGTSGFPESTKAYEVPTFKTYAYGPELELRGLVANGMTIDLAKREANFMELTVAGAIGSCPYLVSWNGSGWVEHGKVLHKAPNRAREYTETRSFQGFRSRFRLEEREPEIAFIDQVELTAILKGGASVVLRAGHPRLAQRDGDYAELMWGHAVDLTFRLPDGVAEDDVLESRLSITGHYVRYSGLMALQEPLSKKAALPGAPATIVSALAGSRASDAMCPVPARITLDAAAR